MPYSALLNGFSFSEVDTKKLHVQGNVTMTSQFCICSHLHIETKASSSCTHCLLRFLQQRCELFQLSLLHTDGFQIGKAACLIEQ